MIVAFDVETIPNPNSEREDAALVPPLAIPISCAFYSESEPGDLFRESPWSYVILNMPGYYFAKALQDEFDKLGGKSHNAILLSFNGRSYDVPVLVHYFASHGMKVPKILNNAFRQKRWEYRPHVDLREAFCWSGLYSSGTLHDYCIAYGVESPKNNCDGSKVPELYAAGKFQEIAEYNLADAIATYKLYEKWVKAWRDK
jgi:hypothetical protein